MFEESFESSSSDVNDKIESEKKKNTNARFR